MSKVAAEVWHGSHLGTAASGFFDEEGDGRLQHGDRRTPGRHGHQHEEDQPHHLTEGDVAEGNRQGDEHQPRPTARFETGGKNDREQRHAGGERNQRIEQSDGQYRGTNRGLLRHVGAVDHDRTNTDAQSEKGMAHGGQNAVLHLARVEVEKEIEPLAEMPGGEAVPINSSNRTFKFFMISINISMVGVLMFRSIRL